jgi:hypothetical protein
MGLSNPADSKLASIHLTVRFEGLPAEFPGSRVYVLDPAGEVLTSQAIFGCHVELRLPYKILPRISLAIAPSQLDPCAGAWHPLYETDWQFEPGVTHYALRSVPENVWRWWLVSNLHGILWPARRRERRFAAFREHPPAADLSHG